MNDDAALPETVEVRRLPVLVQAMAVRDPEDSRAVQAEARVRTGYGLSPAFQLAAEWAVRAARLVSDGLAALRDLAEKARMAVSRDRLRPPMEAQAPDLGLLEDFAPKQVAKPKAKQKEIPPVEEWGANDAIMAMARQKAEERLADLRVRLPRRNDKPMEQLTLEELELEIQDREIELSVNEATPKPRRLFGSLPPTTAKNSDDGIDGPSLGRRR